MIKLAILIPTLTERKPLFDRCLWELQRQRMLLPNPYEVEIIVNEDNHVHTTGAKRNFLIQSASTTTAIATAFLDDDDLPGETYLQRGIEFANSEFDVAELWGQIYWDGVPGKPFHHSVGHDVAEDDKYYYRPPNHLNFMKLDKIKSFKFEDKNFGEDMCWAVEIQEAGILQKQMPIPEIIYHYFCGNIKHKL